MLVQKILNNYNADGASNVASLLTNNQVYTYYTEDTTSTGETGSTLRYIGKSSAGSVISGIIGKEQLVNKIINDTVTSPLTAEINTRYIFTNSINDKTIRLPLVDTNNIKLRNQAIEIIYTPTSNKKVYVQTNDGNSTLAILDKIVNKYLFVFSQNTANWVLYSPYENNYTYWHEEKVSGNITAQPFRRYIVTAANVTITLPSINTIKNNFKISIQYENTTVNSYVLISAPTNSINYKGADVVNFKLTPNNNHVQIIYNSNVHTTYKALTNVSNNSWITRVINTSTSLNPGYKYICKGDQGKIFNDMVLTLPSTAADDDRIGIFIEDRVLTNIYVKIKCGVAFVAGSETIATTDSLDLPSQLIYIQFVWKYSTWHVTDLSIPNHGRNIQADGLTIQDVNNTFSVLSIASRLSGVNIDVIGTVGGITTLSATQYLSGRYIEIGGEENGVARTPGSINCTLSCDTDFNSTRGTIKIENGVIKVNNLYNKISGGTGIRVDEENGGVISINLEDDSGSGSGTGGTTLPALPGTGTYVLACVNGTLQWVATTPCS